MVARTVTCPHCKYETKHPGPQYVDDPLTCIGCGESSMLLPDKLVKIPISVVPPPLPKIDSSEDSTQKRYLVGFIGFCIGVASCAALLIPFAYCNSSAKQAKIEDLEKSSRTGVNRIQGKDIDFGGHRWAYRGALLDMANPDFGDVPRFGNGPKHLLNPYVYTCEDPNLRLLRCLREDGSMDQVYEFITCVQLKHNGTWLRNGLQSAKMQNGDYDIELIRLGKTVYRTTWYQNNQMRLHEAHVGEKQVGPAVAYWPNGNVQYIVQRDMEGKEVFGQAFNEDGTKAK